MFRTVCWRLCLGQFVGDYVWDSVMAIMFGIVCWRLCLGQCVGDYVWDSVLAIVDLRILGGLPSPPVLEDRGGKHG